MIPAIAPMYPPVLGPITQDSHPQHPAVDIACLKGTPVRASHAGVGKYVYSRTLGLTYYIESPNGTITSYSHLESVSNPGWKKIGEEIGACGSTGVWSSGPHVHFESNIRFYFTEPWSSGQPNGTPSPNL